MASVVTIGSNSTNTGVATVTLSNVTVPAGSTIFVVTGDSSSFSSSFADGVNTYTKDEQTSASNGTWAVYYCINCLALSSATLTYTKGASSQSGAMGAFYVTGLKASPLDGLVTAKANGGTSSSTTPSVTSGSPAEADELFVGVCWPTSASTTFSQASGWSDCFAYKQNTTGAFVGVAAGFRLNSGTGTLTYNPTLGTAARWAASVYGFKVLPQSLVFMHPMKRAYLRR